MAGFTKLVPEIVSSSLWNLSSDIRIVWITMLATKDSEGYVRGDAPTLARMANVPLEAAAEALMLFQQPDPNSHTPDNDGRRIAPAPGGWLVLNHDVYRATDGAEKRKSYMRDYMRKYRQGTGNKELSGKVNGKPYVNLTSVSVSVSESVNKEEPEPVVNSPSEQPSEPAKPQPVPVHPEKRGALVAQLSVEANAAFGKRNILPTPMVMHNVTELLEAGHTAEDLRSVFAWRLATANQHAPKSPAALTEPDRFMQWQQMIAEERSGARKKSKSPNI